MTFEHLTRQKSDEGERLRLTTMQAFGQISEKGIARAGQITLRKYIFSFLYEKKVFSIFRLKDITFKTFMREWYCRILSLVLLKVHLINNLTLHNPSGEMHF